MAGVHGLDDLVGVDALQIDRGHAEVAVPESALDDVQRHALARQFERVRVAQLVRREAPTHAGPRRAGATPRARQTSARLCRACGRRSRRTADRPASPGARAARARAARSPIRPSRPRGADRPCLDAPAPTRGARRDRAQSDRAPPRRIRRVTATLARRSAPGAIPGHRGRRAAATKRIQRRRTGHGAAPRDLEARSPA